MDDLRDLYQEVILDHGKNPRNFRHPEDANRHAEGDNPLCGDRLTIADLVLYCCMDFAAGVGQSLDPGLPNISAWFARIDARPSAKTSLHPAAEKAGRKG